ncbi:MAG: flagellar biosynthesis protein FlgE [Pseudomonadota bacterium]
MAVNPMLNSGVQGIQRGLDGLERAASTIANSGRTERPAERDRVAPQEPQAEQRGEPNDRDAVEAMVDLKLYKRQVQASAKVIESADAAVGFLLDTRA